MMIRLKLISVLLFAILTQNSSGQKNSNIDFDEIKSATQDSSSSYFYPLLVKRFQDFDTTLTEADYKFIYYGNIYIDSYNPYGTSEAENNFIELYNKEKYNEAIPYGQEVIKDNPVNIEVLFKMTVCYHVISEKATARKYAKMYFSLLNVIYNSGDGKSIKTSYVVIKVPDEYQVLNNLKITSSKQSLIDNTDVLTIITKGQKPKKGQKKIKYLYFNVSKPFATLEKLFNKKE